MSFSPSTSASTSLTRYPRWVWALTGLTAAYATYTIWNVLSDPNLRSSNSSGLRRRGAIRQRHRSPQISASANLQSSLDGLRDPDTDDGGEASVLALSSPFGTVTAQVNEREHVYPVLTSPPSIPSLRADFGLPDSTLRRIYREIQHVLLDVILSRLSEDDAETFLLNADEPFTQLMPLITGLRSHRIEELADSVHILSSGDWGYDEDAVAEAFARRVDYSGQGFTSAAQNTSGEGGGLVHIAETIIDESEDGGNAREPGQGIKGIIYNIAEEQARRQAYVHRGTRCDSCAEFPIRGVRWHCINCPDYDLCSQCEALYPPVHPRTHVFAKIKIPISTLAQPHHVHDLWYSGDPLRHWPSLTVALRKRLVSETGFEDVAVEAYYEQFTCIANAPFPNDPLEIKTAIDRRAFRRAMSSDNWAAPLEPSFLFDRMFSFYDRDNNSLIDFNEFIQGLAYLRNSDKRKNMDRILKGYDVDGDGVLSRADFVRMFSAKYAVQRHIIREIVAAEEAEIVAHTGDVIRNSQPISAAFMGEDVPYGERRIPEMKAIDSSGDLQIAVDGPLANSMLRNEDAYWNVETANTVAARYERRDDIILNGESAQSSAVQDIRRRYERVETVAIEPDSPLGPQRYLVETDPRRTRGQPEPEPPEQRWRTDIADALAGGAAGSSSPIQFDNSEGSNHDEREHAFPEFIFERGRAYAVTLPEQDFGKDVLFQVVQDGINELLDPLFKEHEKLARDVRATRAERRLWRREIDQYVRDKKFQEELRRGAQTDPLLATALRSQESVEEPIRRDQGIVPTVENDVNGGHQEGEDATFLPRSQPETTDASSEQGTVVQTGDDDEVHGSEVTYLPLPPSEQPVSIVEEIRARLQHENEILPIDNDGIEDLEFNIRTQPLEELLASAGYSLAHEAHEGDDLPDERGHAHWTRPTESPQESRDRTEHERVGTVTDPTQPSSNATSAEIGSAMEESSDEVEEENVDPTMPQNRPNAYPSNLLPTLSGAVAARDVSDALIQIQEDEGIEETTDGTASLVIPDSNDPDAASEVDVMRLSPSSPPTPIPLPPGSPRPERLLTPPLVAISRYNGTTLSLPESNEDDDPNGAAPMGVGEGSPATRNGHLSTNSDRIGSDSKSRTKAKKGKQEMLDEKPSQARLEHLSRLDVEEQRIVIRGGPGRLSFAEVEEILKNSVSHDRGALIGLVEGWLEWAGF